MIFVEHRSGCGCTASVIYLFNYNYSKQSCMDIIIWSAPQRCESRFRGHGGAWERVSTIQHVSRVGLVLYINDAAGTRASYMTYTECLSF